MDLLAYTCSLKVAKTLTTQTSLLFPSLVYLKYSQIMTKLFRHDTYCRNDVLTEIRRIRRVNVGAIIGGALGRLVFSTLIVVLFIVNIKRYTVTVFIIP